MFGDSTRTYMKWAFRIVSLIFAVIVAGLWIEVLVGNHRHYVEIPPSGNHRDYIEGRKRTRFHVLLFQRFFKQRVVVKVGLTYGKIIGRPPSCVHLAKQFGIQRSLSGRFRGARAREQFARAIEGFQCRTGDSIATFPESFVHKVSCVCLAVMNEFVKILMRKKSFVQRALRRPCRRLALGPTFLAFRFGSSQRRKPPVNACALSPNRQPFGSSPSFFARPPPNTTSSG